MVLDDVVVVSRATVVVGRSRGNDSVVVVTAFGVASVATPSDADEVVEQADINGNTATDINQVACVHRGRAIHLNSTENVKSRRGIILDADRESETRKLNRLACQSIE